MDVREVYERLWNSPDEIEVETFRKFNEDGGYHPGRTIGHQNVPHQEVYKLVDMDGELMEVGFQQQNPAGWSSEEFVGLLDEDQEMFYQRGRLPQSGADEIEVRERNYPRRESKAVLQGEEVYLDSFESEGSERVNVPKEPDNQELMEIARILEI